MKHDESTLHLEYIWFIIFDYQSIKIVITVNEKGENCLIYNLESVHLTSLSLLVTCRNCIGHALAICIVYAVSSFPQFPDFLMDYNISQLPFNLSFS